MAKSLPKIEAHDLTTEGRDKLSKGLTALVVQLAFIDQSKEMYNEQVGTLADELGLDAAKLKKAAMRLYKQDFFDKVREQDEVESILTVSGQLASMPDEE